MAIAVKKISEFTPQGISDNSQIPFLIEGTLTNYVGEIGTYINNKLTAFKTGNLDPIVPTGTTSNNKLTNVSNVNDFIDTSLENYYTKTEVNEELQQYIKGGKIESNEGTQTSLSIDNQKIIIPETTGDQLGVTTGVGYIYEEVNSNGNITLKDNRIFHAFSPVTSYASLSLTVDGSGGGFYHATNCILIWKPNGTPTITDTMGLVYVGDDCANGTFTPVNGAAYKIEFEISTVAFGYYAYVKRIDSDAIKAYISSNYVSKTDLATYGMWYKINLGELNWKNSGNLFYARTADNSSLAAIYQVATQAQNRFTLCRAYTYYTGEGQPSTDKTYKLGQYYADALNIYDTAYTDVGDFKDAVKNVYFYILI